MSFFTPRRLLRLYPGLFRLRYGTEFVALLEQMPITRAVVLDTLRSATWEWLRWTRIGRLVLALLVAFPLAWIGSWLGSSWPVPSHIGMRALSWPQFAVEVLIQLAPFMGGTFLVMTARHPSDPRRRIGFTAQLMTLAICAVAEQWVVPALVPAHAGVTMRNWLSTAFFITVFLVWIFNVEGGGLARYPRRVGPSRFDDDR